MKIFETNKLLIRELQIEDVPALYAYGKEEQVVRYQNWGPISLEDATNFYLISKKEKEQKPRTHFKLGIVLKSTKTLIGDCGFNFINEPRTEAEIGYNLHPNFWGHGYGTELIEQLVKHIGTLTNDLKLFAECDSRNLASRRILEKNNFKLLEMRKEDLVQKGTLIDTCRYMFQFENII